ncbi:MULTISPECIES: GtrA family protein [unclassified Paraflavitalea]|uniref:GtrA family protein n=1 Tax=unclassified Paraflavitalea TaxID=2798305 RepID=UPI003D338ADD
MKKGRFLSFVDLFYPIFKRFMPIETYYYAVMGGLNTVIGLLVYALSYTFIFKGIDIDLGFYAFKPHTAALFLSFCVNLPLGFLLNKYLVFTGSTLKGRIQLFRYSVFFISCLFLNYVLLKVWIEMLHMNALLAQLITTSIVVTVSYFSQKYITFKKDAS